MPEVSCQPKIMEEMMRKKSHISLAKYIVNSLEEQDMVKHKKAFYLGSILPDCKPSFLTERHEIEGTFPKIQQEMKMLVERKQDFRINTRVFYRSLGEIIHYIADYFTFPHNAHYTGSLKEHCAYEEQLKKSLREYIRSGEAEENRVWFGSNTGALNSTDAICEFIRIAHDRYVKLNNNVREDCRQIVALCYQVAEAVVLLSKAGIGGRVLASAA